MNMVDIIMQIAVLVFAVIIHEISHGWVAYKLGDPTAKEAGRLTLNPLPHIDPFMSLILPALLVASGSPFIIGGAKPVPVDPSYFKEHKRDVMLVSLAGPGSNVLLALLGIALFVLSVKIEFLRSPGILTLAKYVIMINIVLAVFNLIPVPPLDGSKVVMGLLPDDAARAYAGIAPYGFMIIILMLILDVFDMILMPVLLGVQKLLNFLI